MDVQPQITKDSFWQRAAPILDRVVQTQGDAIHAAAVRFADCIAQGGVIHPFGTGHSRAFSMELAGRAGGLMPVDRMDFTDLATGAAAWPLERVLSPEIEHDAAAGEALLASQRIEPQDVFIIASNSGVNAAVIEVALRVTAAHHFLVAVTSLEHTTRVDARHPSGKKLADIADVVIDNCGPLGDAILELPDGHRICALSSLTGALIAQMLNAETAGLLLARGEEIPYRISANTPGGREHNAALRARYGGRVRA